MKTYIIGDFEVTITEQNIVSFARDLVTGKFIKHDLALKLVKGVLAGQNDESNHIVLDVMFFAVAVAVCLSIVMFLSHLSVAENGIILLMLVVLRMMKVANLRVEHLSNKRWSI